MKQTMKPATANEAPEILWEIAEVPDDGHVEPPTNSATGQPQFRPGTLTCYMMSGIRQSLRRVVDEVKQSQAIQFRQTTIPDRKATHLYLDLLRLEKWLKNNFAYGNEDREHIASRKWIACRVVIHPVVSLNVPDDELDEMLWRHERGDAMPLGTPHAVISRFDSQDKSLTVVIRTNLERSVTLLDAEPSRNLAEGESSHEREHLIGACPDCGRNDGAVYEGSYRWFVCHEHKIRWQGGTYPAKLTEAQEAAAKATTDYLVRCVFRLNRHSLLRKC